MSSTQWTNDCCQPWGEWLHLREKLRWNKKAGHGEDVFLAAKEGEWFLLNHVKSGKGSLAHPQKVIVMSKDISSIKAFYHHHLKFSSQWSHKPDGKKKRTIISWALTISQAMHKYFACSLSQVTSSAQGQRSRTGMFHMQLQAWEERVGCSWQNRTPSCMILSLYTWSFQDNYHNSRLLGAKKKKKKKKGKSFTQLLYIH